MSPAMDIMQELVSEEEINSYLFLNYMISYGFNPENYKNILEIFQSPEGSISRFLKKYKQFLLSNLVSYNSLKEVGINGACGYFNSTGIVIPKTLKNDDIFLHNKTLSSCHKLSYNAPNIEDFDIIIGNGIFKNIKDLARLPIDKYIGYCGNIDKKETKKIIEIYMDLYKILNLYTNEQYIFEHDKLEKENKELCLIKKK